MNLNEMSIQNVIINISALMLDERHEKVEKIEQQIALARSFKTEVRPISPGGGGGLCHICAIRRRAADQGILFGLRIRHRVSFFEPDSKTGCQICTISPSQGTYSQYCLALSHWF